MKILTGLKKTENVLVYLSYVALIIMAIYTFFDVLFRYIFNSPLPDTVALTQEYFMPMFIYLSISMVYASGGFVRVTIINQKMSEKVNRYLLKAFDFCALIYVSFIVYGAYENMMNAITMNVLSSSRLAYPMAPAYFVVMLGGIFLCIRLIEAILTTHPKNVVKEE